MDLRVLLFHEIETFFKGPSKSWVCEPKRGRSIVVVFKQAFLDGFSPCAGIYVGDEPIGPGWGDPLSENQDCWPSWVSEVRWKKIPKEYLRATLAEVQAAVNHPRVLN